ncbi:MAG: sodium:proton antiporter [Gammaproteobacteria bacterium]
MPLPLPLVQIAFGALIASTLDVRIELDPELFLLLFIAPLLFLDGWRIPREGLTRDKWTIGALSLGLVVFTVVGAGYFIHWMIPAMPLAVAFALAAVLSPTDAVAVSAIAARAPIPKRLVHILEGEALLNDASGLVCMRFAVAAAITGSFSIVEALGTFAWLAVGGVFVGLTVTVVANAAKDWVSSHFGEETGSHILVSLLIPFGAYMLAGLVQASGILAAVAAGIAMNREERAGRALPVTRIRRAAVWDAVQFAGNGVVFVLLGDQLPGIVAGARGVVLETGHDEVWWLLLYILAVFGALLGLRGHLGVDDAAPRPVSRGPWRATHPHARLASRCRDLAGGSARHTDIVRRYGASAGSAGWRGFPRTQSRHPARGWRDHRLLDRREHRAAQCHEGCGAAARYRAFQTGECGAPHRIGSRYRGH